MGGEPAIVERVVRLGDAFFRILSGPRPASHTGPAFVLIHGIGTSHRYLARLHRELARTDEVHAFDLPGFGGMPKPDAAMDVPDMAAGLASVLDHLGLSSAVLVGHSMGAQWVVELAATRPDLAAGVVLIGPVADDARRTTLAQSAALFRDALREPFGANAVVFLDYARCGPVWFATQLRCMIAYPIEERIRRIRLRSSSSGEGTTRSPGPNGAGSCDRPRPTGRSSWSPGIGTSYSTARRRRWPQPSARSSTENRPSSPPGNAGETRTRAPASQGPSSCRRTGHRLVRLGSAQWRSPRASRASRS